MAQPDQSKMASKRECQQSTTPIIHAAVEDNQAGKGSSQARLQVKPLPSSQNGLSPADYPLPWAQTPGGQTFGDVDSDMAVSHARGSELH